MESLFCDWSGDWGQHHQNTLRGLVAGSHWTQGRLHDQDATVSPLCQLCGEERGSLHHRCYQCPGHEAWRRDNISPALAKAAAIVGRAPPAWRERFARGLFPEPGLCVSRPPFDPSWGLRGTGVELPLSLEEGFVFTGVLPIHGEALGGECRRRAASSIWEEKCWKGAIQAWLVRPHFVAALTILRSPSYNG